MTWRPGRLRCLISYHYFKNVDLDDLFGRAFGGRKPDVFADSGAFSGHTQGAKIDWREYAGWVKRWGHWFTTYANLDAIGDPQATLDNQRRLEDAGLHPLPVFHVGSPWRYLEQYIEAYPYIALGGMVPYASRFKTLMPWLVQAFQMAKGKSVFHGFGATSWRVLSSLPWYSVDSSAWGSGFRYGMIALFDEQRGKFFRVQLGSKDIFKNAKLIRDYGFSPADFADRSRNTRQHNAALSALSYMRAESWLQRRFGEIHIPKREGEAGLRLYLADTAGENLAAAATGVRIYLADALWRGGTDLSTAKEYIYG